MLNKINLILLFIIIEEKDLLELLSYTLDMINTTDIKCILLILVETMPDGRPMLWVTTLHWPIPY